MTMLRAGGLLDVLTPLSDCRQESVEKMARRILGFRICIGFGLAVPPLPHIVVFRVCLYNGFLYCGFLCARLISSLFSGYHAEGYYAPPIPYGYHAEGYHARTDTIKLTGYHVCRVTTPELPLSMQTSAYRRVITTASSF